MVVVGAAPPMLREEEGFALNASTTYRLLTLDSVDCVAYESKGAFSLRASTSRRRAFTRAVRTRLNKNI